MKTIKNKQGVVLFIVVIYFLVLSLLLGGLFYLTIGNFNDQKTATEHSSAYYVAESGINLAVAQVEDKIKTLATNASLSESVFNNEITTLASAINGQVYNNASTDSFSTTVGNSSATLNVTTSVSGAYRVITIQSTGVVDGKTRTLTKVIRLKYASGAGNGFVIDKAILTKEKIDITLESFILNVDNSGAKVATYSTTNGAVTISTSTKVGDIFLLPSANSSVVDLKPSGVNVLNTLTLNPFPAINFDAVDTKAKTVLSENKSLTLNSGSNTINPSSGSYGGYYVPTLDFSRNMTINVTGNTFIVTDNIDFGNAQPTITFTGSGKLEIYVGNPNSTNPNFNSSIFDDINNNTTFGNSSNVQNLVIYVSAFTVKNSIPNIQVGNGSTISGSFMFENSRVTFGQNISFNGYLVTDAVNDGSSPAVTLPNNSALTTNGLIFAPKGTVSMNNLSQFKGSIVSNNVKIDKGTLVYDPTYAYVIPTEIIDPISLIRGSTISYEYDSTTEVD